MKFSDELEGWLTADGPKSLGALASVFAEKGFAVTILVLMTLSTAPVPTGGVLLAMQIIAVLLAGEMLFGRRTVWVPRRWRDRELGSRWTNQAIPFLVRLIRRFERHSRPRWSSLFERRWFVSTLGGVILVFAIVSTIAPPFTGLDKLPAIGAAVVALSIVLEDVLVSVIGVLIGTGGVILFIAVGAAVVRMFVRWF